jgi:hypothetical protein
MVDSFVEDLDRYREDWRVLLGEVRKVRAGQPSRLNDADFPYGVSLAVDRMYRDAFLLHRRCETQIGRGYAWMATGH